LTSSQELITKTNPMQRDQVFISYSHKDKKLFDQLQTSLKPLVRDKKITVWDDTKIKSGDMWREQIKAAVALAKAAVLIVSPDYLASDFIAEHELPPLLEAAQKEGLRILWIAARFSMYEETEIARFQAVNDPTRPLAGMSGANRERELVRICKEIKSAISDTAAGPDSAVIESQLSSTSSARGATGAGVLTIDATHFLGDGGTWDEPAPESQPVKSLLDALWPKLRRHVPAHTYGGAWVLRNKETGEVYWGLTVDLEAYHGLGREALTLKEAGIVSGMTLEVVPLSGSKNKAG
jgi:hypothetical protein